MKGLMGRWRDERGDRLLDDGGTDGLVMEGS